MTGQDRFSDKDKRKQRRRNHIAKDLREPKFHQRIVEERKQDKYPIHPEDYFDEDEE